MGNALQYRNVTISTNSTTRAPVVLDTIGYAEVQYSGRPAAIPFHVGIASGNDEIPFSVFHGEARVTHEFVLCVTVSWDQKTGMPRTRQKGEDNVDLIVLDPDGRFVDIQVGLVTRRNRFFVTAQRVFEGWVTRTRPQGVPVHIVEYTFTPGRPEHAYPGATYDGTWVKMAEAIAEIARHEGMSRQLSRTKPAKWATPVVPEIEGGWLRAECYFFNLITGTGVVHSLENDRKYFVHFSNIVGGGPHPVLEPMKGCYFRPGIPQEGHQGLPPVKSLRAA